MSVSKAQLSVEHAEWSLTESAISQSCRRFLHILQGDDPKGEAGFYVNYMCGAGSGILLRMNKKFYILTASHVVKEYKNTPESERNTSPFWFPLINRRGFSNFYDFLYPYKMYLIGDLIDYEFGWVDVSDVVLIELCDCIAPFFPHGFIDLDADNFDDKIILKNQFFEGQFLNCAGFPFEKNDFEYDVADDMKDKGFTHSTKLIRHIDQGFCLFDEQGKPFLALRKYLIENGIVDKSFLGAEESIDDSFSRDGMSGGVVFNIMEDGVEPLWAGMVVSGSSNLLRRFIPAYVMKDAILNHKSAKCIVLDYEKEARDDSFESGGHKINDVDVDRHISVMEGALSVFKSLPDEEKRIFLENFIGHIK